MKHDLGWTAICILGLLCIMTWVPEVQVCDAVMLHKVTASLSSSSWNKTYVYGVQATAHDLAEFSEGGFLLVGSVSSVEDMGTWVLRTDTDGEVVSNMTYYGWGAHRVAICDDAGLVLTSAIDLLHLIRVSPAGDNTWNRTYPDGFHCGGLFLSDVVECDTGFALVGSIETAPEQVGKPDTSKMVLLRTDSFGYEQWRSLFGSEYWGYHYYYGHSIVECADGGFLLTGFCMSEDHDNDDIYAVRTDSDGNMIWNRTLGFGGTLGFERGIEGVQCSDGGFVIVDGTGRLVKLNQSGSLEWTRSYGTNPLLEDYGSVYAGSVVECSTGGFAISGMTYPVNDHIHADGLLIRTDENGDLLWMQIFKTYPSSYPSSCLYPLRLVERVSGGFALACTVQIPGRWAAWLIMTPDSAPTSSTSTTTGTTTATQSPLDITLLGAGAIGIMVVLAVLFALRKRAG